MIELMLIDVIVLLTPNNGKMGLYMIEAGHTTGETKSHFLLSHLFGIPLALIQIPCQHIENSP